MPSATLLVQPQPKEVEVQLQSRDAFAPGILLALLATALFPLAAAAAAPVIDEFVASPAVAVPGQVVHLTLRAHDPDCATSCSSGCGLYVRSDLLSWDDATGRVPTPFANSIPSASGSPWNATVDWTAPPADGTYTVTAQVSDSGTSMCGGRQTTVATLAITVSSVRAPVIDSFDVAPTLVNASSVAALSVVAHDPDSRPLTYEFSADAGTISHSSPTATTAQWTAPPNAGTVIVRCRVTAPGAPSVTAQKSVEVSIGTYTSTLVVPNFTATRTKALPDDRIAMVDGRTGVFKLVSRSGAVAWSRAGLQEPVGVARLANDLWVLERRGRVITRWGLTGTKKLTLPAAAATPSDIAGSDTMNELALADSGAGRVLILDPASGAVKRAVGEGVLLSPTGVWYAGTQLAVADAGRNRVFVFDATGTLLQTLGDDTLFVRPQAVGRDDSDGTWIISDSFSGEIHVIDPSGQVRGRLGGYGQADGQLVNPVDVSFLPNAREISVATLTQGVRFYSLVSTQPRPLAASNVTASDRPGDDGGAIQVSWATSPDDPTRVTGYWIERDNGGDGVYTRLGLLPSGSRTYLDLKASIGGCHVYRVVATSGVVESPSGTSPCVASLNDLPPDSPGILSASALTPDSIALQWAPVSAGDLAAYAIELQWPGGSRKLTASPFELKATVSGLAPDVDYVVTIRAVDTASNLSPAKQALVRTWPDEAPPAPSLVTVLDTNAGGELVVTWEVAEGRVPVDYYALDLVPQQAGWPSKSIKTNAKGRKAVGLVNEIGYVATVRAYTPWGRAGESRSSSMVAPSAPVRLIPLLRREGREGTQGIEDSAGIAVKVPFGQEKRKVKFLYRALGTPVEVLWNGRPLGDKLADTGGLWVEAELLLARSEAAEGRLDLRNYSFPSPVGEVAVWKLDLVPLAPGRPATESFDTVIDVRWEWQETRSDLKARLIRTDSPGRVRGVIPGDRLPDTWETMPCLLPTSGVCRDPFLAEGTHRTYGLAIESPAGWQSEAAWLQGQSRPPRQVPPVTDLVTTHVGGDWLLRWTPISFFSQKNNAVEAVKSYRVYKTDGIATLLLTEVSSASARLPQSALVSDRERFVVRAVDDEGRESE
jgi:hypothetical protein